MYLELDMICNMFYYVLSEQNHSSSPTFNKRGRDSLYHEFGG